MALKLSGMAAKNFALFVYAVLKDQKKTHGKTRLVRMLKMCIRDRPMEHSGGDGWSILHGDTLQIIRAFKPQVFDALITDPPYACLLYTSRCV